MLVIFLSICMNFVTRFKTLSHHNMPRGTANLIWSRPMHLQCSVKDDNNDDDSGLASEVVYRHYSIVS